MQKYSILLGFVLMLFACKTDRPESTEQAPELKKDEAGNVVLPERMKHVVDFIWWYQGYVSSREEQRQAQRGKWFQFKKDGTFTYGKFQDQIGEGTWKYNDQTNNLYLLTDDGAETRQWETMMSHTNDIMVWMGPPTGPNAGDQAKLEKYLQRPTDKDVNK